MKISKQDEITFFRHQNLTGDDVRQLRRELQENENEWNSSSEHKKTLYRLLAELEDGAERWAASPHDSPEEKRWRLYCGRRLMRFQYRFDLFLKKINVGKEN